jgi:hypothetical protein
VKDLTSLVQLSNRKVQKAMENSLKERDEVLQFTVEIQGTIAELSKLTLMMIRKIYNANSLSQDMTTHLQALERLSTGSLDPGLITPSELENMIRQISEAVETQFPNLALISKSPAFYYAQKDCITVRNNDTLFVLTKFPLSNLKQTFALYKTEIFKIPVNVDNSHATTIYDLPNYVAVSADGTMIYEFDDLPIIRNHLLYEESRPLSSDVNLCTKALLQSDEKLIEANCKIVFLREGVVPRLMRLSGESVLFIAIQKFELTFSNNTKQQFVGCSYCIKSIACGVEIRAHDQILFSKISNCKTNSTIKTYFAFNRAILTQFFEQNEIAMFKTAALLETELNVILPEIKFAEQREKKYSEIDHQINLDLKQLTTKIKNNQIIYEQQSHILAEDFEAIATDDQEWAFTKWRGRIVIILGSITGLCVISLILLTCKTWRLATAVMLLSAKAKADKNILIYSKLRAI